MYLTGYVLNILLEFIVSHIFCFSLKKGIGRQIISVFPYPVRNVNLDRQFNAKGVSICSKFLQNLVVFAVSTQNCNCSSTQILGHKIEFIFSDVRTPL